MAVNIGPRIGIDGEAEYRREINQIIQQAKTLDTQMKAVASSFGKDASAKQKAAATTAVLSDQIKTQEKRVELLNKMLERSISEKGEDAIETQKWRQAVNSATADLNRMNNELDETATKKVPNFGKALAIATAAITTMVAALKSLWKAVSSYSDFEQLSGGVKTLFKDSADTVLKYAENAYSTSGLSANEYLETVTGFAASLIDSLGNDTGAAAMLADVAVTDMSDNANKLGTDMSMLQSAYTGFAKGQFTLLDNLKLGYGGTKEEMERLLSDAEKLEGAMGRDFDINNFADIVTAIHLIQEEMEISGATALEASTTIEGSTKAMAASWKNLVAGLGNADADAGNLAGLFVSSVETAMSNIVPAAKRVIASLPQIMPQLAAVASDLVFSLADFIVGSLPALTDAALKLLVGLAQGILRNLPAFIAQLPKIVTQIVQAVLDNLPLIVDLIPQIIDAVVEAIVLSIPAIVEALPAIIAAIILAIGALLPQLVEVGKQLGSSFINGLVDVLIALAETFGPLLNALIIDPIRNLGSAVKEAGANIIKGLWEGISSSWEWLKGKISEWVGNFWAYIKGLLGIHSPSDVTEGYGVYLMQGLANGINGSMGVVKKAWNSAAGLISPISTTASFAVGGGRGAVVNIGNVTFNGYSHEVGMEFVADLNRQLGGLYA